MLAYALDTSFSYQPLVAGSSFRSHELVRLIQKTEATWGLHADQRIRVVKSDLTHYATINEQNLW